MVEWICVGRAELSRVVMEDWSCVGIVELIESSCDDKLELCWYSDICKKMSCKVGVLLRLHNLIPWSAKLRLYKSNILPHLICCDIVWHFCNSSDKSTHSWQSLNPNQRPTVSF